MTTWEMYYSLNECIISHKKFYLREQKMISSILKITGQILKIVSQIKKKQCF